MSTNHLTDTYPEQAAQRDRWILEQRDARGRLDPLKPHAFLVEEERADSGEIVAVATIFLTNRECPWRCLMCDLWKNTHTESVSLGAIPAQIDFALAELAKQGGGGFEPARSGDVAVAGINRDQRRSRVRQTATPTLQMSRQRRSPSSRPSPPTAVELSELQRTWSADFSPLPEELPRPEGGGLKSALLNSRAVPSPPREGETGESGSPLSASRARLAAVIPAARQIKLYNSGSFFDPRAIPPEDHEGIARRVAGFERVIVECHPALVGESVLKFRDLLDRARAGEVTPSTAGLEVAMGLETAHPEVLEKLNKRMTLEQFQRATEFLGRNGIALRVFVLVQPPFLDELEALHWAGRSVDFAFDCGATVVSLIPTRSGNGALDALASRGHFSPPKLSTLEAALDYGIELKRGRVFADLWDLERFSDCSACFERRRARLNWMNLGQVHSPVVDCEVCQGRQAGQARRVPGK